MALHGTDPATVYLSAAARMRAPGAAALDRALYEEGSLTRLLAMRRTMFVVATTSAPVVLSAAARAIAAQERRKLLGYLADGGGWDEGWLARLEESVLAALAVRGEATAAQLASDVPRLREQVVVARGKPYEATQAVSTRVLRVLAAEGRIVRRRPLGGWTSSQYRWAPGAVTQAPPAPEARVELVRRWLAAYGPGTEADLKWWTGWTLTEVRRALTVIGTEQVLIDGETGHVLPDDAGPVPATPPWAALLPALDPTPMGWQRRDWYLPHGRAGAGGALRPVGQHRPHRVVERAGGRRLGAARRRRGRPPSLRRPRPRGRRRDRGRGRPAGGLAGRCPRHTPLPDTPGAGVVRVMRLQRPEAPSPRVCRP